MYIYQVLCMFHLDLAYANRVPAGTGNALCLTDLRCCLMYVLCLTIAIRLTDLWCCLKGSLLPQEPQLLLMPPHVLSDRCNLSDIKVVLSERLTDVTGAAVADDAAACFRIRV